VTPELVGPAEIGAMLGGLSRQRVYQLTSSPTFPAPAASLSIGKVWRYDEVAAWASEHGRAIHPIKG
jgi:predicted DNA-binding transcriptional regulator AlpA